MTHGGCDLGGPLNESEEDVVLVNAKNPLADVTLYPLNRVRLFTEFYFGLIRKAKVVAYDILRLQPTPVVGSSARLAMIRQPKRQEKMGYTSLHLLKFCAVLFATSHHKVRSFVKFLRDASRSNVRE